MILANSFSSTPVLIIGYSRVSSIRMQIEKLLEYKITKIYLSLDFSANTLVQQEQLELIQYCSQKSMKSNTSIVVWQRKRNHGVAVGVLSAIEWFFSDNESGIIVEDDLVFDETFLEFCTIALEQYKACEEVLMISGNRYDSKPTNWEVVGTNYPQIWGWATWRSKWQDICRMIQKDTSLDLKLLKVRSKCYFYSGALRARFGYIDTWDIPLAYEMLTQRKICILPPVNLVSNIGADQYAVHTRQSIFPLNFPIKQIDDLVFPSLRKIKAHCEKQNAFLEKNVFQIKNRHLFSPFKLWMSIATQKVLGRRIITLRSRMKEAERFVH